MGANLSAIKQAKSFVFCFYLFFSKCQIKRFGGFPNIPKFSVLWPNPAICYIRCYLLALCVLLGFSVGRDILFCDFWWRVSWRELQMCMARGVGYSKSISVLETLSNSSEILFLISSNRLNFSANCFWIKISNFPFLSTGIGISIFWILLFPALLSKPK